jgi:hypothetical protein
MNLSQKYDQALQSSFDDNLENEAIKSGDNYMNIMKLKKDIEIQEDLTGLQDELKEQMVQNFLNEKIRSNIEWTGNKKVDTYGTEKPDKEEDKLFSGKSKFLIDKHTQSDKFSKKYNFGLNENEDLTGLNEDEIEIKVDGDYEIEIEKDDEKDQPKIRRSDSDRLRRRPYSAQARFRAGLNEEDLTGLSETEEEVEEGTGAASSGAYSQPAIWAKDAKNWKFAQKPTYGGKGSKFVTVKNRCRTYPYCNQGDINALNIFGESLNEAVKQTSKKINKPYNYVAKLVIETISNSSLGKKMTEKLKLQMKNEKQKRYSKKELEEIITRSFYKSPVTDPKAGIVGVSKMNLPIGQMFTMAGNKPKYEA